MPFAKEQWAITQTGKHSAAQGQRAGARGVQWLQELRWLRNKQEREPPPATERQPYSGSQKQVS